MLLTISKCLMEWFTTTR